jgi:membrane-bound inhibitor of C-type lysozyme
MSFATPQSVTVDSVATDLHRVIDEKTASTYSSADKTLEMRISHQETKSRTRHLVRLDKTVVATDPLSAESAYQKAGVYIVIDEPIFGFDDADLDDLTDALKAWLSTANITALLSSRH